jgi:hypothetical protein
MARENESDLRRVAAMAGSAAITPSDFLEVIGSPQRWEFAGMGGRQWNFGGLWR